MKKIIVIFNVFCLLLANNKGFAQDLSFLNSDDFTDAAYFRFLEMLSDLELSRNDSLFGGGGKRLRVKQNVVMSANGCLEPQPRNGYQGDAVSQTIRYKLQVGEDWRAGFVLGKDVGEKFQRRFPFYDSHSYYLAYRNTVLGCYHLRLGSGLILNQQFSLGKSFQGDAFMSSGTRLSPHASADEYNYMQGVASHFRVGRFSLLPFVSYKKIDAVVKDGIITSIPTDGYHRTPNEMGKRGNAEVLNTGLHASFRKDWFECGLNVLYTHFSLPFVRPTRAYNIYYYRGQDLFQYSTEFHAHRFGFEMRGEAALDQYLNVAAVMQFSHALGEDWKATLLLRHFGKEYKQIYGATVSDGSSMQGEQGAMLALVGSPLPHLTVKAMLDRFRFCNVQYPNVAPYDGYELRTQTQYVHRGLDFGLSYRVKSKKSLQHSLDGVFAYYFDCGLKLKTQLRGKNKSFAVAQAIIFNNEKSPIAAELQGAYYEAEDYDSRIYLSERNILYGLYVPMLYGKGFYASASCTYKISKRVVLDVKYITDKHKLWGQLRVTI